jgi:hypothetical protein
VAGGDGTFTIGSLVGVGTGVFVDATAPYTAFVFRDAAGTAAAPQGQSRTITAYNSATGQFTTAAFVPDVNVGDTVLVMHPRIAELASVLAAAQVAQKGTVLQTGSVSSYASTTRKVTLSAEFPEVTKAYQPGTEIIIVDAHDGQAYSNIITEYTSGRVATLAWTPPFTPTAADVVYVKASVSFPR